MAKTTVTHITDDLDGSRDAREVTFALEGTHYTIDLSKKNAAALEKALAPYISAATKVGRPKAKQPLKSGARSRDLGAIRTWAKSNGIEVSERGRIPVKVLEQYDQAHS